MAAAEGTGRVGNAAADAGALGGGGGGGGGGASEAPGHAGVDSAKAAEVYGFVGWMASGVAYACYLLWAFLPDSVLNSIHISYYPSKYWAVAAPAYVCVAIVLALVVYIGLNLVTTPELASTTTLADEHTRGVPPSASRGAPVLATPEFADMPITAVNHMLFRAPPPPPTGGPARPGQR